MEFNFKNNELIICIDSDVYNLDIIHKCFYWYGNVYSIDITKTTNTSILVTLRPLKSTDLLQENNEIVTKIKQDLMDYKLRDIVTKETKLIRELLIAKAFAYYDANDDPKTDVTDPVGFNPENK